MEPRERKMLEETYELVQKNNRILRAMRRSLFLGRVFRVIYWVVIIGAAIGAYYYIQPYVDQFWQISNRIQSDIGSVGKFFNAGGNSAPQ